MKVIFLDIDGVLNVMSQERDKHGSLFHNHLVTNLKHIIDKTGAKLVISSSWRLNGIIALKEMWTDRNLPGEIIDITPNLTYGEKCKTNTPRGKEIQLWLNNNKVNNYCIIDDDTDMLESQMKNFVQTSENISHPDCIDIGYGLTRICAENAIKILNNTK